MRDVLGFDHRLQKHRNELNSFTKINSSDEIGKISMEFSLAKEMLKNNKIILDNTIKIKTAEIELANEELKDLNFQSEKREKFLETLFEAIPFPIFYKNEHFRYIKCNTAFADFLGKSKKEIYGKTVYDISPARLAEVYHKEDKKLFENGIIAFSAGKDPVRVRFLLPLPLLDEHIDEIFSILEKTILEVVV